MRTRLVLAIAAAALGFGLSEPAAAGWDDSHYYGAPYYRGHCCGGTVYVHHHAYLPPRYQHVYHFHAPSAQHVHVVHYGAYPYANYRGGYFTSRYYWPWRGYRRHW